MMIDDGMHRARDVRACDEPTCAMTVLSGAAAPAIQAMQAMRTQPRARRVTLHVGCEGAGDASHAVLVHVRSGGGGASGGLVTLTSGGCLLG
eukprot:COSAG02_NODE_5465_length_4299_cov_6.983095_2_plen_92_part_00